MTALFQRGDFTLASGEHSNFKIQFEALKAESVECIAQLMAERLPKFSQVFGVPTGALELAEALRSYSDIYSPGHPVLVVDDVWTTGNSMKNFIQSLGLQRTPVLRAVVFARNPVPANVMALFQMPLRKVGL